MALSEDEYEEIKRKKAEERKAEEEELERKEREFAEMRKREIMDVGEMRLHIASRVAASLSANMALEAESVTERAFSIADAMIKHIENEIDNT